MEKLVQYLVFVTRRTPIRVFYTRDFRPVFADGWAFLTDEMIYVAWRPTKGNAVPEPESATFSDPQKEGGWVKSSYISGDEGETSVIEVGDAATYGNLESFMQDILSRNPNPKWVNDKVIYKAKMFLTYQEELGLSEKQIDQIEEIKYAVKREVISKDAEIDLLKIDIKEKLYADKTDVKAIDPLIEKKYALKKEKAEYLVAQYAKIKEVLSDEQYEEAKKIWCETMKK